MFESKVMTEVFPDKKDLLLGHDSQARALEVPDYPYGYKLRTTIRYWIESKPKHGQRFMSQTLNPKTGKWNKPKASTYWKMIYMYTDEKGHVSWGTIQPSGINSFKAQLDFLLNVYGIDNIHPVAEKQLREWYATHIAVSFSFDKTKYSTEGQEALRAWTVKTVKHAREGWFKDILNHEPKPRPDLLTVEE